MLQLPEEVKVLSRDGHKATFEIAPLMPGYGATIANPLRRALLSSLEGVAITSIKIRGVDHEFSTLPGVLEDVVEIILNVKKIRCRLFGDGPVKLQLEVKGEKEVTVKDIDANSEVEFINPDQHIATLTDKKAELVIEFEVEKGIGYVPLEQRQKEKLAVGVLALDAVFSPVKMVNFKIDNIRVGQRIDFNKVTLEIETDGSIEPDAALKRASEILIDHFKIVSDIKVEEKAIEAPKKKVTKKKRGE